MGLLAEPRTKLPQGKVLACPSAAQGHQSVLQRRLAAGITSFVCNASPCSIAITGWHNVLQLSCLRSCLLFAVRLRGHYTRVR
jgi:hypothetical protein